MRDAGDPASPVEVFEVPLDGPGGAGSGGSTAAAATGSGAGEGEGERPNWRRAVAIAMIAGTVLGILAAVVIAQLDDDGASPPSSTGSPDELATGITTPPTLPPLDTLPPPEPPRAVDDAPQPTTSQDRALFDGVALPSYPVVTHLGLTSLVGFDVRDAVGRLGTDRPLRSETHLELGTGGYVIDVVIERDPVRDRYAVEFHLGGATERLVYDVATDEATIVTDAGEQIVISGTELVEGTDSVSAGEQLDRLMKGPVRPDTLDVPATRGRQAVELPRDGVAREFVTVVSGTLIPEWQIYAFSPVFEFPVEDRPSTLEYAVFVDTEGEVVRVNGLALIGDVPQLVTHRIVAPTEPIVIDLPTAP